jgi:ubiquinone/menaquinone biosynthesis C-methylase UbiE
LSDAVRKRFGATADRVAALQEARAAETERRLRELLSLRGDERALDVGTGAGAFALALAPLVREVVGLDLVPELLERAQERAPANAEFVEGDAAALPFDAGSFDLVTTARTLHHAAQVDCVVGEMARVLVPGGTLLVLDQIAPADPEAAAELNRFEVARDASTTRVLADAELRALFETHRLELVRAEFEREERDLERYLDLAGCEGAGRERARSLAPRGYAGEYGWYVLRTPPS